MKIHDKLVQGTNEWFELRAGKMTGSHAQEIGNNGKGLDTYITKMMAEFYSSGEKEFYTNKDMERGNELEDQARSVYAFDNGVKVEEVGFIEFSEYSGVSPDGLIGDNGMLEIKCPNDTTYFKHLLDGEKAISSKYIWQMQMQMLLAGRQWCDYLAYNENFEQSSFIYRVHVDSDKARKIMIGIETGIEKIKLINNKINDYGKL